MIYVEVVKRILRGQLSCEIKRRWTSKSFACLNLKHLKRNTTTCMMFPKYARLMIWVLYSQCFFLVNKDNSVIGVWMKRSMLYTPPPLICYIPSRSWIIKIYIDTDFCNIGHHYRSTCMLKGLVHDLKKKKYHVETNQWDIKHLNFALSQI